ncbi:hypothetical protein ANCCEY_07466 [Ancylostoma ceylanicum]|uniref:Uncharacterized protein n=1 Tax=Ancylostoma ceylanicum TaxID=53326 RepID=A0A0D6LNM3_9BILA|nr:hypothetical protein ANCCEY_07466 [Ancylostoma ceylanicum]
MVGVGSEFREELAWAVHLLGGALIGAIGGSTPGGVSGGVVLTKSFYVKKEEDSPKKSGFSCSVNISESMSCRRHDVFRLSMGHRGLRELVRTPSARPRAPAVSPAKESPHRTPTTGSYSVIIYSYLKVFL